MQPVDLDVDEPGHEPLTSARHATPQTASEDQHDRVRAWFAIHREVMVDRWLAIMTPECAGDHDPAVLRQRLDGFLRAIVTAIVAPAPVPYIERVIGRELARLCQTSTSGLHTLRVNLPRLLTDDLPTPLRGVIDEPLERTLTEVIWGYCQEAMASPGPDDAAQQHASASGNRILQTFLDQYPGLLMVSTVDDDTLVAGNERIQDLLGYTLADFMAMDIGELVGPETPEDDFDVGVDLLSGRIPIVRRTTWMRHRDGHMVQLAVRAWTLKDDDGNATHLVSEFDVPAADVDGDSHWQRADKRFRHLAQLSHDILMVVGPDGLIRYASPSIERNLGADPDAIVGTPFTALAITDDQVGAAALLATLAHSPPRSTRTGIVRLRRHDGLWRWFEISGANLLDVPDFAGFSIQARDITDRQRLEALLNEQVRLDWLTGLLNRRGLVDQIEAAIARYEATGETMALLFIDLDRFKGVNDTHGHDFGDQVLTQMASRLPLILGTRGTAGRLGGDEFVVLLRDADRTEAESVARDITAALSVPVEIDGRSVSAGASVGIVLTEYPGQTMASLLRAADDALYRAKATRDGNPVMGHVHPD